MKSQGFQGQRVNRRSFMQAAGMGSLALASIGRVFSQTPELPEIRIRSNYPQGLWYYDPVGLYLNPGQTVRWICTKFGATVTAFHPDNDNRELRIPEGAQPFDSGLLGDDVNNTFEWTFEVEGTYDYFSRNHEVLGLVGRIVVGRPGGPAERPLGSGGREGWAPIFPTAREVWELVSSQEVVEKKLIRYPTRKFGRRFPY